MTIHEIVRQPSMKDNFVQPSFLRAPTIQTDLETPCFKINKHVSIQSESFLQRVSLMCDEDVPFSLAEESMDTDTTSALMGGRPSNDMAEHSQSTS